MHIMIDLETVSTRPDAAIIQIGAVLFEPANGGKILNDKPFNRYTLLQDGMGAIDASTFAWWLQQPHAAKVGKKLDEEGVLLGDALADFVKWPEEAAGLKWDDIGGIWAKPSNFDIAILHTAFAKHGVNQPWAHRITRCARTLFASAGGEPEIDWTGLVAHDAFDDALGQAMQVQKACM